MPFQGIVYTSYEVHNRYHIERDVIASKWFIVPGFINFCICLHKFLQNVYDREQRPFSLNERNYQVVNNTYFKMPYYYISNDHSDSLKKNRSNES